MKQNRNNSTFLFLRFRHVVNTGIVLIVLLLGQGCAPSLVTIERNELKRLKDQPLIHVVHYSSPSLSDHTPISDAGTAIGGILGGLASVEVAKAEGENWLLQI